MCLWKLELLMVNQIVLAIQHNETDCCLRTNINNNKHAASHWTLTSCGTLHTSLNGIKRILSVTVSRLFVQHGCVELARDNNVN